jgi:hypothetical protein
MYIIIYIVCIIIVAIFLNNNSNFDDDEIVLLSILWPFTLLLILIFLIKDALKIISNVILQLFNKSKQQEIQESAKELAYKKLDQIDFKIIEQYVRIKKLKKLD